MRAEMQAIATVFPLHYYGKRALWGAKKGASGEFGEFKELFP